MSEPNEIPDLIDIAAEAFDTRLQEGIARCHTLLDEHETETERRIFFLQHPEKVAVRLYGVQAGERHAVFAAALGFVPDNASFQMYVGDPEVREGSLDLQEPIGE